MTNQPTTQELQALIDVLVADNAALNAGLERLRATVQQQREEIARLVTELAARERAAAR